jgi:probable rRNA maturation factor
MIYIQFADVILELDGSPPVSEERLSEAAQGVLETLRPGAPQELTLLLSDDAQLQALNQEYLGINAPTDVLSFPAGDVDPDSQEVYLGDVIISLERAHTQARLGGHSVEDELQLLVVHGVLHLLGYDHADPVEKAAMWAVQSQILFALGCKASVPEE